MKRLLILMALLILPSMALAQGARYDGVAQKTVQGFIAPIAGATITVCTSSATGTPCSPLVTTSPVTLCTDATCTVAASNPFLADANGNFGFWATPGSYKVSITAAGVTGQLLTVTLPCAAGISCVSTSSNNTFTGNNTHSGTETYNGIIQALNNTSHTSCTAAGIAGAGFPAFNGAAFPLGPDLNFVTCGPADEFDINLNLAATTTTTTLNIGANTNVLVGSTALFAPNSIGNTLIIGRETANEELISPSNWAIVDGTHINVTCAKTHSGTTDIEQGPGGKTILYGSITWEAPSPSQLVGRGTPVTMQNGTGNIILWWPANASDPWPYGGLGLGVPLTGIANGAVPETPTNLILRNSSSSFCTIMQISTGAAAWNFCDTNTNFSATLNAYNGNSFNGFSDAGSTLKYQFNGTNGNGFFAGAVSVGSASGGNILIVTSFTTTAATSDNVTVTGMTASGHCFLQPTNPTADTLLTGTYVSAKTTNQITVTHAATAGATFDVGCTPN